MRGIAVAFVLILVTASCRQDKTLFTIIDPADHHIEFANVLNLKDTINILDNEFVYNGGGVAIGDLNNDQLPDVFFTGNQADNKLYINRGNLEFLDATLLASIVKQSDQWSSGVTMLDINRDGLLDIYVCNTMSPQPGKRRNALWINQGIRAEGIPEFKDMAAEYGLDDDGHDSAVSFLDYDLDGDLDVFIAINFIDIQYPNQFFTRSTDGSAATRDKLLRNDWNETLKHPVFTDVSVKSGIVYDGYSHSVLVNDFNSDGWLDIYVCNDYVSNDILYMNNRDGTFTNRIGDSFKHFSYSAMGSDVADVNNDGREDFFVTEMLPVENKRKKLFLNANNYTTYVLTAQYKYEYQYVRNTLQLNMGNRPDNGMPQFGDVSFYAGTQETEWSWSTLMADYDNDGNRDILITNGFPRDITDHDFGAFRSGAGSNLVSKQQLYNMIPEVRVRNFMFKNNGDLTFRDVSAEWGINIPTFSNGAAYADFDLDGDLDYVVNNIDDWVHLYRNNLNPGKSDKPSHFLRVKLAGSSLNPDAFGAQVTLAFNGVKQTTRVLSGRGYLSQSEPIVHFGLGQVSRADTLSVRWPDGKTSMLLNPKIDQVLEVKYAEAEEHTGKKNAATTLFAVPGATRAGLAYRNDENDFIDFNFQRTLPHKFSQYGPAVAVGDINGDGLEDVVFGGSSRFDESVYVQTREGKFRKPGITFKQKENKREEDEGILLFDADHDGDNDLYLARGSYQYEAGSQFYQHVLAINDGNGNFRLDTVSIGKIKTCSGPVKAADYDQDGDLDLFVGGRVLPRAYPKPDRSYILRNDTKVKDKPVFTDVTAELNPELQYPGMISDALWTDFDGDGKMDLLLAPEWSSLLLFRNTGAKFENVTQQSGVADFRGWWTSLAGADVDQDGDTDYWAGNFGENIYFKCSSAEPLTIYAKDFDGNGLYDPFISCYWRDSTDQRHEYFYHTRDDMIKQLVMIRTKFETYADFGRATVDKVFTAEEMKGAQILKANWMASSFLENLGQGKFRLVKLPKEAQLAPVYGMLPYDYDQDGFTDLLLVGNDFGMELLQGRADAMNGLVLHNEKGKEWRSVGLDESHFFVPKDARALSRIRVGEREWLLATQNRDSLKVFMSNRTASASIAVQSDEAFARLMMADGKFVKTEFYYGHSFHSQEPRRLNVSEPVTEVVFYNSKGVETRRTKTK
ncbi:MAG: VCBS repeat-containing protein [Cyclobacteriaceae bacterium]